MKNIMLTEDKELNLRYERYRTILENLTIMDDIFMRNVLKSVECTEYILQVIMEDHDLQVVDQALQKDYKNLQGRSAVLDCVAKDSSGKQYNMEFQQDNEGAEPKRARYHSGLMDMNILNPRENYAELPVNVVIFITQKDVLGYGLPIYHIERKIAEIDENFRDESHIIYVNTKAKEQKDTELGRLMHDLNCKSADEMYSEVLAKRVSELKETQEGVEVMCREMEELYHEGITIGEKRGIKIGEQRGEKRGEQRGERKAKMEMAISLAKEGMSIEKIAEIAKESVQLVQKWLDGSVNLAN